MVEFLSPEWISRLDAAVRADASLKEATAGVSLTVEQHVTRGDGADTVYRVVFDHGDNRVDAGTEPEPDVRFTQDLATAVAIACGELSAQRAFMSGDLVVGGNLKLLVEHRAALAGLSDLFAGLRAETAFAVAPEPPAEA